MALQPFRLPGPATLALFSTHPSQLDTAVPSQPLCSQSHPHVFRHTGGCVSVFTSDFELSTPYRSFRSVRINIIPRHLAVLCFHTLTHSFAPRKTLTPAFSIICALFPQNTRGGGTLLSDRSPLAARHFPVALACLRDPQDLVLFHLRACRQLLQFSQPSHSPTRQERQEAQLARLQRLMRMQQGFQKLLMRRDQ